MREGETAPLRDAKDEPGNASYGADATCNMKYATTAARASTSPPRTKLVGFGLYSAILGVLVLLLCTLGVYIKQGGHLLGTTTIMMSPPPCTLNDLSTGVTLRGTPPGNEGTFLRDATGAASHFSAVGSQFHYFGCVSGHRAWLDTHELSISGCMLNPGPAAGGPFPPGARILLTGSSYVLQLTNAILANNAEDIVSITGGRPNLLGTDFECGCLSGQLSVEECNAKVRDTTLSSTGPFEPGDGFTATGGLPEKLVTVEFKNGAVVHAVTNHIFQVRPLYTIDDVVKVFGLESVRDLTHIVFGEVSTEWYGSICEGWAGENGQPFQRSAEVDWSRKGSQSPVLMLEELVKANYAGELLYYPGSWSPPAGEQLSKVLENVKETNMMIDRLGFTFKVVPTHMQHSRMVPYKSMVSSDSECFCGDALNLKWDNAVGAHLCTWPVHMPVGGDPNLGHEEGCQVSSSSFGHGCEPGLPDVGFNMLVHAIYTPVSQYM